MYILTSLFSNHQHCPIPRTLTLYVVMYLPTKVYLTMHACRSLLLDLRHVLLCVSSDIGRSVSSASLRTQLQSHATATCTTMMGGHVHRLCGQQQVSSTSARPPRAAGPSLCTSSFLTHTRRQAGGSFECPACKHTASSCVMALPLTCWP